MKKKKSTKKIAKKSPKKKVVKKTKKKLVSKQVKKAAKKKVAKRTTKRPRIKRIINISAPENTFENKHESDALKLPNDSIYDFMMSKFSEGQRKAYEGKPIPYAEGTMLHPDGSITGD